jgi:hypothetical protein
MLALGPLTIGIALSVALVRSSHEPADVVTLRAQSPIPTWCDEQPSSLGWLAARRVGVSGYCNEIGQGHGMLLRQPRVAIEHAKRAAALLPGDSAAVLLLAQAHALSGDYATAWQEFGRAQRLSGYRLDNAVGLQQFARSARLGSGIAGNSQAISAYRQLLSMADGFPDESWRVSAGIEASLALIDGSSAGYEQATAVIDDLARSTDSTQFPQIVRALRSLLGDGGANSASSWDGAAVYPEALLAELTLAVPSAPKMLEVERLALIAFGWEHWDAAQAREQWSAIAARDEGAWGTRAAQRVRRLAR